MEDLTDRLDKIVKMYEERLKQKNLEIEALVRNNEILIEAINEASDTLQELWKITSTYHKKIIMGQATREDVKECSNIVQRSLRYARKFEQLKFLYAKVYKTLPDRSEIIDITKRDKIEC
jgi:hypothetical protein